MKTVLTRFKNFNSHKLKTKSNQIQAEINISKLTLTNSTLNT